VTDRLPPQNIEAEQSVLGSLLIDPDAVVTVSPFLRPEDFYRETHQMIYTAIRDLNERHIAADFVTVVDELERRNQLEAVGGASYLSSLINAVPTTVHVEHYAHIVERQSTMRRLISAAGQIAAMAYEDQGEADEVIDKAEQLLFDVSQRRISRALVPIKEIIAGYYDHVEFMLEHPGDSFGVPTGFVDLDAKLKVRPDHHCRTAERGQIGTRHLDGRQCCIQEQCSGGHIHPGDVGRASSPAHGAGALRHFL